MPKTEPLLYGQFYHIYDRGNNAETLFREERNYPYFLKLDAQYVEPVAETYAYCLMPNHFHLLVRIKDQDKDRQSLEDCRSLVASHAFAVLFSTYTKAFNKAYQRSGSLFEKPFRRILVDNDRYFAGLVAYIHQNPQKHGFVDDFRSWPYTSYRTALSDKPTRIQRDAILDWFDGRAGFEAFHSTSPNESMIEPLVADDFM